jgi:parallel beta-helix repeat protein
MYLLCTLSLLLTCAVGAEPPREIVVTKDVALEKNAVLNARLVVRASHVTIDGQGATLVGPGQPGKPESFQGFGIVAEGCSGVIVRNLKVKGFSAGLVAKDGRAWLVEDCDFSDNFHNPEYGWGSGSRQGGMIWTRMQDCVVRKVRANRVWNGLDLDNCDRNLVADCDLSHCSNVCLKLQSSTRNQVVGNNLSYGIRIKPGEVHARDSTSVLLESGSNDNLFERNDITHGGDGIFIRVLNLWVSTGNVFIENDCSYANNNCVESWSPGNTYIRNKANHGSYGFWLGGSDQTVLIGNEAAYNGLPDGSHNAPEAGFSHGGIVIVGGPSSHTKVLGNFCHHNNGGGIVFRGDVATKGQAWKTRHWIIQNNRLEDNTWGIHGQYGDWIFVADNVYRNNAKGNYFDQVTNLTQLERDPAVRLAPRAALLAPRVAKVGETVVLDASTSSDPQGRTLSYRWDLGGPIRSEAVVKHVFTEPGFQRVGLSVSNGALADLAFRDLVVVNDVKSELGTEGQAGRWGSTIGGDSTGRARLVFEDDSDAVIGETSLRFQPIPYPGMDVTAIYPATRDATWDLSKSKKLTFWIKFQNPNITGFQDPGPGVQFYGPKGQITLTPTAGRNYLRDVPNSEGRWMWQRMEVPLDGDKAWTRKTTGEVDLKRIDAVGFTFDSWEADPFTIWLDGVAFE